MLTCRGARFHLSPVSGSCWRFSSYFFPPNCSEIPRLTPGDLRQLFSLHIRQTPEFGAKTSKAWSPSSVRRTGRRRAWGGRCPGRDPPAAGGAAGADFSLFLRTGRDSGRCFFLGAQPLDLMPFGAWLALEESGQTVSPVIPSSPALPVLPTGAKSWLTTVISE